MNPLDEWRAVPPAARRAVEERLRWVAKKLLDSVAGSGGAAAVAMCRAATDIEAAIAALQAIADGGA